MRFWLTAGMLGFAAIVGWSGRAVADEVTLQMRDQIEDRLSSAFIAPQTAIWHFDADLPYVGAERVVCGWVNFQSAQQKYVGFHQFYAIFSSGQITVSQIEDPVSDTSGELAEKLKAFCGKFKQPG